MASQNEDVVLMKKFGLSEEQYIKKVSDTHIDVISHSHCERWRPLHSYLDLEKIVVSDIDRNPKHAEEVDKRSNFFSQWKERKGSGATYQKLVNALLKIDCRQDAESVCKLLADTYNEGSTSSPSAPPTCTTQSLAESFERFPYLDNVPKEERRKLEARLQKESGNMINVFAMLVTKVTQSLNEQGVIADLLKILIKNSKYAIAYKAIKNKKNVNKLMLKLSDYWSFFDYDILQLIINCQCPRLTEDLAMYEEEFKNYCRRRLCEVPEGILGIKAKCDQHLYLKCDENFSYKKTSLWDIKVLNNKLSELLEIKLVLVQIHKGCLELKMFCFSDVPYPLTCHQNQKIMELGIVQVRHDPKRTTISSFWSSRLKEFMILLCGNELKEMSCKDLKQILDIDFDAYSDLLNQEIMEIAGQILRPSQIFDGIYLGSFTNANAIDDKMKINGIACFTTPSSYKMHTIANDLERHLNLVQTFRTPFCYEDNQLIIEQWDKACSLLKKLKTSEGKVLVCCFNGNNESAAMVIAYAMKEYKMSLEDALSHVKSKRNIITLSDKMIIFLKIYERSLRISDHQEHDAEAMEEDKQMALFSSNIKTEEQKWACEKWWKYLDAKYAESHPLCRTEDFPSPVVGKKKRFFASLPGTGQAEYDPVNDDAADYDTDKSDYESDYDADESDYNVLDSDLEPSAADMIYSANLEYDTQSLGGRSASSCISRASSIYSIGSSLSAA